MFEKPFRQQYYKWVEQNQNDNPQISLSHLTARNNLHQASTGNQLDPLEPNLNKSGKQKPSSTTDSQQND
ncbi:hypothetical protein [Undibacterium oligocarboniphilum]|uniref:Uncharacterized protein n=1 Tax=Undibacterium oligocarboniphilum TaxID=666702 RepID=A0A850QKA8_9BURK|nr:hypothetical protein [Undibacterium oligocarboniphilum]MBC3871917.1 hypothetical protein [Undibacterium oligocarboniphilum]NVO79499.1 hypothetical protein [Undibacterium oligocarboniphilum]